MEHNPETAPVWQAKALTKRYGRHTALQNAEFSIGPGRLVGLLGPNGAGKTTLLKLSAGLLTPSEGEVRICGLTPGIGSKRLVSYLPDRMVLPGRAAPGQLVALYADFFADFDADKARAMLADLKLDPRAPLGAMSKGMQEKVQLCLAMSRAAKLYLLDEPLGGVDPAARDYILDTILRNYSEEAAVIISTHLITDIEKALDEVLILKDGAVHTHEGVDALREAHGKSVDEYFREVFQC